MEHFFLQNLSLVHRNVLLSLLPQDLAADFGFHIFEHIEQIEAFPFFPFFKSFLFNYLWFGDFTWETLHTFFSPHLRLNKSISFGFWHHYNALDFFLGLFRERQFVWDWLVIRMLWVCLVDYWLLSHLILSLEFDRWLHIASSSLLPHLVLDLGRE